MKKLTLLVFVSLLLLSFTACKDKSISNKDAEITQEEALSLIQEQYGSVDTVTGYEYQWEFEEISKIDGIEYYNFLMTCIVTEKDASGNVTNTYSEYKINVLVSLEDETILEARENTDTKNWEIQY